MKKALRETQALRAGCSKAEPKKNSPAADPLPGGAERPKFNQLVMVITFTYRPSSVRIDAWNFELSWQQTHKHTHKHTNKQTHSQDRLQYTAPLILAHNVTNVTQKVKHTQTAETLKKPMLTDKSDRAWFSRLLYDIRTGNEACLCFQSRSPRGSV